MNPRNFTLLLAFAASLILIGFVLSKRKATGPDAANDTEHSVAAEPTAAVGTVLLVALDGFRGDYLNPEDTPNLWNLLPQAAWSQQLTPPFPSLTFPSHVTLATGRSVSGHGIPSNQFYDAETGVELRFPGDSSLLKAEPIWTAATRQGRRALAYDWPLSHNQSGPFAAAYFEDRFDGTLSDADRVGRVLDLWAADPERAPGDPPLRLVTSYAKETDSVGHREGPDAPETREAARRVDALLGEVIKRAISIFEATAEPGEQLHFVFAADHGMTDVTHLVNIGLVLGEPLGERILSSTSGNLANLHLAEADTAETDAEALWQQTEEAFAQVEGARVFRSETLPPQWSYPVEGRTGDRVVVLPKGYTFDRSASVPVQPLSDSRGPRGMHGYPPDETPEMGGLLFLLRHPTPFERTGDLGPVRSSQVHATISGFLGIAPSEGAEPRTVWEGFADETSPPNHRAWRSAHCFEFPLARRELSD